MVRFPAEVLADFVHFRDKQSVRISDKESGAQPRMVIYNYCTSKRHSRQEHAMADKSRKQQIEEMLTDEPNDPFLRYGLAMEHLGEGDIAGAVKCFSELIALSPDYVPAYLQAGQTLIRLGRTDEAREVLERGSQVARRQSDEHAYQEMQGFLAGLG
jgi:predicted Zn-dependent protease